MRLRNGKFTKQTFENKLWNILVENTFDIINFINKDKRYQIDNLQTHKKSQNTLIIENICNLFYVCFKYDIEKNYGVIKITFECDYRIYDSIIKSYNLNKKHINNINTIWIEFYKSSLYKKTEEKILDDYKNILNFTNTNVKYKMIKIIKFICLISLCYYYFHMVIIETFYNDCLLWCGIRKKFDEFKNNHHDYCNVIPMSKIITYSVKLYTDLVIEENEFCKYIRNFTMKI